MEEEDDFKLTNKGQSNLTCYDLWKRYNFNFLPIKNKSEEEIIRDILSMGSNRSKKENNNNNLNYNGLSENEITELEKKHEIILPKFMRKMLTIEKTFTFNKKTYDFSSARTMPYYITVQKKENADLELNIIEDEWNDFIDDLSDYRAYLIENFNHGELPIKKEDEFLVLISEIDNETSEIDVKHPLLVVEKSKPNGEVYRINKTQNKLF